ncbi:hypothetical protein V6N12_069035 [Hibiscus sabdariffa]|uniref:Uncharacterized protein n=1 Tax=Hibiscus sabdariffa TaxID=183260 RepID=A0ABR2FD21_9ROSI
MVLILQIPVPIPLAFSLSLRIPVAIWRTDTQGEYRYPRGLTYTRSRVPVPCAFIAQRLVYFAALTKDPESTQAENSSTCRDTYLGRQGKYNRECDMISIFFQTPLDQDRVKPRPKTISRADPKPKHTKSTWSTSLSREKSCFIKITLLYDFQSCN